MVKAAPLRMQDSPALCRNPVAPQEQIDCDVLLDMAVLLMKEYAEAMGYTESGKYVCTCSYTDERLKAKWIMMTTTTPTLMHI
jgi:hypothetical protein